MDYSIPYPKFSLPLHMLSCKHTYVHAPPHMLTPSRHPTDAVEDEARLCRDLDKEVSELREECEEGRVESVAHYEDPLASGRPT